MRVKHFFCILFSLAAPCVFAGGVTNVFQMQEYFPVHNKLLSELKKCIPEGNYLGMDVVCSNAVAFFPNDATWWYNRACAQVRLGRIADARASIAKAADLGFSDVAGMSADTDLALIRRDPAFTSALAKVRENALHPENAYGAITPLPLYGVAPITTSNTVWDMTLGGFRVALSLPRENPSTAKLTRIPGKTGDLIRNWILEGSAAGNWGDIYDNHDRGHSILGTSIFTGLAPTRYCDEARSAGVDTGMSLFNFQGRPTIGNSSTANVAGPFWGSCARRLQNSHIQNLLIQYLSNTIYVYPQHHDYLAEKFGDVFPTRTPYLFISPGSSWTDRPILAAMATALAALRPEVKDALVATGRVSPTLQYLLRASQSNLVSRADYLKPSAHPVVFEGGAVDTLKLARLAHSLSTNSLPPLAPLRVVADDSARFRPVLDYPDPFGERLYDSPFAIARIWRAPAYSRKMMLEVGAPGEKGLRYHWFLGQGDPAKVSIREVDSRASRVEIKIDYHEPPFATPFGIKSSRVDVVCVADDGFNYSAPSFVSWFFPRNEKRIYGADRKALVIDYASCATNYVDPEISMPKDFRDEYIYGVSGECSEIRRIFQDGREETRKR